MNTMNLRYDIIRVRTVRSPGWRIRPARFLILAVIALLLPALLTAETLTHRVEKGENLYRIGLKYGVKADQIRELNGLTSDNISVGQVLKIKEKEPDQPDPKTPPAVVHTPQTAAPPDLTPIPSQPDFTKLKLPEDYYYTVQPGDNLYRTAVNNGRTIKDLVRWNNLSGEAHVIKAGDKLIIKDPTEFAAKSSDPEDKKTAAVQAAKPASPDTLLVERIYVVKKKDTLFSIAKANGMTVDELKTLNNLSSNDIKEGQRIWLAGTPPADGSGRSSSDSDPSGSTVRKDCLMPAKGKVTSEFGLRRGRPHKGIDIANKSGTPIHAALDGVVVFSGVQRGYGNVVVLEHPNFVMTVYAHNEKNLVRVNDRVNQGQQIANMGSTGNSTGPHLHFEYRVKGTAINPRKVLPF